MAEHGTNDDSRKAGVAWVTMSTRITLAPGRVASFRAVATNFDSTFSDKEHAQLGNTSNTRTQLSFRKRPRRIWNRSHPLGQASQEAF